VGREEGLEDTLPQLLRHPRPGVRYREADPARHAGHPDVQFARVCTRNGLLRVRQQVQHRLLEVPRVPAHRETRRGDRAHGPDSSPFQLIRAQGQGAIDDRTEVHARARFGRRAHITHHLPDRAACLVCVRADAFDAKEGVLRQVVALGEQLDQPTHDLQRVIELVRERRDEAGHRGQPIDLRQLLGGERNDGGVPFGHGRARLRVRPIPPARRERAYRLPARREGRAPPLL
jgi:hypothetical protein